MTAIGESYEPSSTAASCACFADCMHHILPIFWQCCSAYKYYRLLRVFAAACGSGRPTFVPATHAAPRRARLWQGLSFRALSCALWSIINNVINNSGHQILNIFFSNVKLVHVIRQFSSIDEMTKVQYFLMIQIHHLRTLRGWTWSGDLSKT